MPVESLDLVAQFEEEDDSNSAPAIPSYAKPGPYTTTLPPDQEQKFQGWVKQNKVPWQDSPTADYDMRGYWRAQQSGDANAKQKQSDFDGKMHFPDTYKTPYHKTFSNESMYATPDAPSWKGDRLVDKSGKVIADETPAEPDLVSQFEAGQQKAAPAEPDLVSQHEAQSTPQAARPDFTQEALGGKLAAPAGPAAPTEQSAPAVAIPRGRGDVSQAKGGYFPPTDIPIQGVKDIKEGYEGFSGLPVPITQIPAARGQTPRPVSPKPQLSPEEQAVVTQQENQRAAAATKIIQGTGEVGSVMLPGAVAAAPLATAASIGTGVLASKVAGAAVHGHISPEAEELVRAVGFFIPSVLGTAAGVKYSGVETPGGEAKFSGVEAFGGRAKAAYVRTPESFRVGAKVGDTQVEANFPRGKAAAAGAEPPALDEGTQAMVNYERAQGNIPTPPPAPPPGAQFGNKVSGKQVDAIAKSIQDLPEDKRDGAIEEAHNNLTKWIADNNGKVFVDGKIHIAKTPEQAESLAAKIINDAASKHDKAQAVATKEAEKAAVKVDNKSAKVSNPAAKVDKVPTAPISGKPPADGNMTTDTAAVQNVVQNANIHPDQQPAVMVKKESPAKAEELAQAPEPVKPEEVAKIGQEDKESGRQILQPSDDVMQNERLAGQAAPELAEKLSHISAAVPGATYDRLRPQKELERVGEKVNEDDKPPETVPDYLASQIAADTPEAKDQLIAELHKHFPVVKVEDHFLDGDPELANYRAAKVQVQLSNGVTAEVGIVPREVQEIANQSHVFYSKGRAAGLKGDNETKEKQYAIAAKMHDEAMAKFNERNGIKADTVKLYHRTRPGREERIDKEGLSHIEGGGELHFTDKPNAYYPESSNPLYSVTVSKADAEAAHRGGNDYTFHGRSFGPKEISKVSPEPDLVSQHEAQSVPLEELDNGDRRTEDRGTPRRADVAERKRVEHLSPEERAHELLTSELTGLPNKRAFEEDSDSEMAKTHPHVGYADIDDFKAFNTILGKDPVDAKVLPLVGEIFRNAVAKEPGGSIKVYHRSGDEFWFRSNDPARVQRVVERVNKDLANAVFTAESPDGTIHEKVGAGLSYGTGTDTKSAEHAAEHGTHAGSKPSRKEAGLRSGSRDIPERVGEKSSEGKQVEVRKPAEEVKPAESGPVPRGTWMNRWNVDEAADRFKTHPVLGKATKFLKDFVEETDSHSDGWSTWPLPAHAAQQLMDLIQHPAFASEDNLRKAMGPIKAFMTKRGTAAGMKLPEIAIEAAKPTKKEPVKPSTGYTVAEKGKGSFQVVDPNGKDTVYPPTKLRRVAESKAKELNAEFNKQQEEISRKTEKPQAPAKPEGPSGDRRKVSREPYDLQTTPEDIGVKQYIQTLPEEQQKYAQDVWKAFQDNLEKVKDRTEITADILNEAGVNPQDFGLDGDNESVEHLEYQLRKMAKQAPANKAEEVSVPEPTGKSKTNPNGFLAAPVDKIGSSYQVLDSHADPTDRIVSTGFKTREEAEDWIDTRKGEWSRAHDKGMEKLAEDWQKQDAEEVEAASKYEPRMGDLVEFKGKDHIVDWVNPGGSMRLKDPDTKERIPGWISPPQVTKVTDKPAPEKTGALSLVDAVYDKLKAGESLGNVTELNKLAEQHFGGSRTSGDWTPKDAFDAMEAGVNKYLLDHGKALMKNDAHDGLAFLRGVMKQITSQGVRTEEQIKNQQFSTPPTESYVAAKVANMKPSDVVLEPSAGNGGLAVWAKAIGAEVHVNEIAPRRQEMLEAVGFNKPTAHDGELINALLDHSIKPTVVIMNPPFSASTLKSYEAKNRNQYGFNHVDQALQRLAPGGRLVAILGGGQANEPNGGASLTGGASGEWFNKIAQRYNVRANVRIHGKEYQKYGTSFATRIIVIDKDGPTNRQDRADAAGKADLSGGRPHWSQEVIQGNFDTLEEAYNALKPVEESRPENVTRPEPSKRDSSLEGRPAESGVGVRPESDVPGVRSVPGRGAVSNGQVSTPVRSTGTGSNAPASRPNGGTGELPARQQQESRPEPSAESEPAGRTGADSENGNPKQQVAERGLYLEQLVAEHQKEEEDTSAFSVYRPTIKGASHPGSIVETKAMATVPMPPLTYKPNLPESVVGKAPDYEGAKLSAVQLEAVSIAGMQNDIILPGGYRGSALIGDGTGVGKGREAAAILWDNWRKGRKRLVWMTKSKDLIADAVRDLEALGATDLAKGIKNLGKMDVRTDIQHEGVLFTTYSLFLSAEKGENGGKGAATRALQVDKWLRGNDKGDGGYMLMDESHMLKNAVVSQGGQVSQIGEIVKKFLENMPALRTVSLSATAATDVMNLGYLDRLGLWGPGTPFPNGFTQFAAEISHGGMSAMEMIARELKAQGKYVSRTLTYKGVKYSELEHTLTPEQEEVYTAACEAWKNISSSIEDTISNTTNGGSRQKARAMSQFYSTQQRFFSLLLTSMKIPTAVKAAEEALASGKSVVITLINTNEAAQNRERDRVAAADDDQEIPDYDFGPGRMLTDLVREHYPVQQYKDDVDPNGKPIKTPVFEVGKDGKPTNTPVMNPAAVAARDELIAKLERDLHMPNNPLDELIEQLGGHTKVAELTGRKQRVDPSTGKLVNRGGNGVSQDKVNLNEMASFQAGKKRIAVLSSAADTGISLHSDHGAKNKQQRVGITLQVGWSADKAMQMMGRINRSNQAVPPEYTLLKSNMGGESRFISSIAKRMESLEALSKGQTRTNSGTENMSKVNFETEQGQAAAATFYSRLLQNVEIPGAAGENETPVRGYDVLTDLGVLKGDPPTVPPADRGNVKRLLNRLLALPPKIQNAVYEYYYDIFEAVVKDAIENGTIDTGVKKLPGDEFTVKEARELSADPKTGAKTFYYPVEAQVRQHIMAAKDMEKLYEKAKINGNKPAIVRDENGNLAFTVEARPIVRADGRVDEAVYILKPGNGTPEKVTVASLGNKWTALDKESRDAVAQAEKQESSAESSVKTYEGMAKRYPDDTWYKEKLATAKKELKEAEEKARDARRELRKINTVDMARGDWQKQANEAPKHRTAEHHLVGGAVMRFWNPIRESVGQRMDVYSTVDAKTGQRVVGIEIPGNKIHSLVSRISGGKSTVTAEQIFPDVLRNGTTYDLEGGIKIRRGRLAGNNIVQVITSNPDIQNQLKNMGVLYERGIQPLYYLPTDVSQYSSNTKGQHILEKILKEYPAKVEGGEEQSIANAPVKGKPSEAGFAHLDVPEVLARGVAEPVTSFLKDTAHKTEVSRSVDDKLFSLGKQYEADVLRAVELMKQVGPLTTPEEQADIYHHLEDSKVPLSAKEQSFLDKIIKPMMEQSSQIRSELNKAGVPMGEEGYVHRVVQGKNSQLERAMAGKKGTGKGNVLSKSAASLKQRTMFALEDEDGNRVVISRKDGRISSHTEGGSEDLGSAANIKTQDAIDNEKIARLGKKITELKRQQSLLKTVKGRVIGNSTVHGVEPSFKQRAKLTERIYNLEKQKESLESSPSNKEKIFTDHEGKEWRFTQATTKEIEANTSLTYYKNATASAVTDYLQLLRAKRANDALESMKADPEFKELSFQSENGQMPPDGWRSVTLPQFKGYYFEPHIAEVLDRFEKELHPDPPTVLEKIGNFMTSTLLLNPVRHIYNIGNHWLVERGVSGAFNPLAWPTAYRAGVKAIKAVVNQNEDFLSALDKGAPMMSHRADLQELHQQLFQTIVGHLEKNPTVMDKIAEFSGYSPTGPEDKGIVSAVARGTGLRMLNNIRKLGQKAMWQSNDMFMLQSSYEKMAKDPSLSFEDAMAQTAKHIPDYRIPTRILNSKAMADFMGSRLASMFGRYHYGVWKSYWKMVDEAAGPNSTAKERLRGLDHLAMLALLTFVMYPIVDAVLKKITHDHNAKMVRSGASAIPGGIEEVLKGDKPASTIIRGTFTPAIFPQTAAEVLFNRDFFAGGKVYKDHTDTKKQAEDIGKHVFNTLGPVQQYNQAQRSGSPLKNFLLGQVGVNTNRRKGHR